MVAATAATDHPGGVGGDEVSKQKLRQSADLAKAGQNLLKKAQSYADYEQCAEIFTDAISLRHNRANLYFSRGRCYAAMGQFQRALFDYSMAVRLEPGVTKHYGSRGYCYRKLGRLTEALKDYSEALKHDRDSALYFFERGLVHYDLDDFVAAIQDFSLALDKRLTAAFRAHFYRGISYRKAGQLELSIQDLRAAIALDPTSNEAHNHLGLSLAQNGAFQAAAEAFTLAIECIESPKYLNNRGLAYHRMLAYPKAIADFTSAINLLQTYATEGLPEAAQVDRSVFDVSLAPIYFNRGAAQYALEDFEMAAHDYDAAIQADPTTASYLHHKGLALEGLGRIREAIDFFSRALEVTDSGDFAPAKFHLGKMYYLDGQLTRALTALASLGEGGAAPLCELRGLVLRDMGSFDEAIAVGGTIEGGPPSSIDVKAFTDASVSEFDSAIQVDPACPSHYCNRGLSLLRMAAVVAREGVAAADSGNAPAMIAAQKLKEQAIAAFNRTLELGLVSSAIFSHRGLAFKSMGNVAQAVLDLSEAISRAKTEIKNLQIEQQEAGRRGAVAKVKSKRAWVRLAEFLSERAECFLEQGLLERAEDDFSHALQAHAGSQGGRAAGKGVGAGGGMQGMGAVAQAVEVAVQRMKEEGEEEEQGHGEDSVFVPGNPIEDTALPVSTSALLYGRGLTRYRRKHFEASITDLKGALDAGPVHAHISDIYYHMGVCQANLGHHALAVASFDQCVARSCSGGIGGGGARGDSHPHYLHERAKSLQVVGEHDRALQDFSRVLEMQPTNARALFRRAFSFKALGLYEEAAEDFEAAKEFEPDDPRLVINYRKISAVAVISLGPAGHEDPNITAPLPGADLEAEEEELLKELERAGRHGAMPRPAAAGGGGGGGSVTFVDT